MDSPPQGLRSKTMKRMRSPNPRLSILYDGSTLHSRREGEENVKEERDVRHEENTKLPPRVAGARACQKRRGALVVPRRGSPDILLYPRNREERPGSTSSALTPQTPHNPQTSSVHRLNTMSSWPSRSWQARRIGHRPLAGLCRMSPSSRVFSVRRWGQLGKSSQ